MTATVWAPQRLPIPMEPLGGEALDSWIEAYARRLRVSSSDLLEHLGLGGARLAHMVTLLTPPEQDVLTAATGVQRQQLAAMTLHRFDGIAVSINHIRRCLAHPPAWRRHTGSRFCPACLGGSAGRWQLTWRLPWSFACPIHQCLLVDYCAGCRGRPAPHRHGLGQPTAGGTCTAPARSATRQWRVSPCGHDLASIDTIRLPPEGPVLAAHQYIQDIITTAVAHTGAHAAARRSLAELHTLAYKGLAALHATAGDMPEPVEQIIAQCGGTTPAPRRALDSFDAHAVAVGSAIAVTAHRSGPAADAALTWIIHGDRSRRQPAEPHRLLQPWRQANPALTARVLAALDAHLSVGDRLGYGTAHPAPRAPGDSQPDPTRRAAALAALLWPTWSIRMLPVTRASPIGLEAARAALAALTLLPDTHLSYQQALHQLGNHTGNNAIGGLLAGLDPDQLTTMIRLLTQLARALDTDPPPINYTRRRALLSAGAAIDPGAYAAFATRRGWRPPSRLQLRILDHHLAVALTGAHRPQGDPDRPGAVEVWNPLLFTLPTALREFVDRQASDLLRAHGINEPLTWHPPLPETPAAHWPGLDPDTINAEQLAAAVAEHAHHRCAASRVGELTGLHGVHLRLATQILTLDMPEQQWDNLADGSDRDLTDPVRLGHLYQDQNLALHELARLALTSEPHVRRVLTRTGITPESTRSRRASIPRVWFEQHYLNTGKSLEQVAAETGYSRNTLSKYARQHDIPIGRPANPFDSWPKSTMPSAAVIVACSGPRGIEYVQNILRMPGHPTRRAAAVAIGITEKQLSKQRQRVERAARVRIFQPGTPLTVTKTGARFLQDAAKALNRLDHKHTTR
ncbi:MAG: TniQ family protein [Natronosporangium sp.]